MKTYVLSCGGITLTAKPEKFSYKIQTEAGGEWVMEQMSVTEPSFPHR